jgi:hypothetical protein
MCPAFRSSPTRFIERLAPAGILPDYGAHAGGVVVLVGEVVLCTLSASSRARLVFLQSYLSSHCVRAFPSGGLSGFAPRPSFLPSFFMSYCSQQWRGQNIDAGHLPPAHPSLRRPDQTKGWSPEAEPSAIRRRPVRNHDSNHRRACAARQGGRADGTQFGTSFASKGVAC